MIRIGIIGCGQIAQHHMNTYRSIPDAQMVVCADINETAARESSEKHGIPEYTTNLRDVLARDDIDAVDVCLHNNFHRPATELALAAGKHVYCEKPMAGAYRDAEAMLAAARSAGKHLHIQLSTLYTDETLAARELIELGELGQVFHARSTGFRRRGRPYVDGYGTPTFVQKRFSSGGAIYDMGVYHISQILFLLGNPNVQRISGKTYQRMAMDPVRLANSNYDVEELGLGFVRFDNDVTMDLIEAWAINLGGFEGSSIVGDKGGIRLSPFSFHKSIGNIDINGTAELGSARFRWNNVIGTGAYYANSQAHWIAALSGKCDLWPTAEVALNTMLVSEGVYLSSDENREVTAEEVRERSVSTAVAL